MTALIIGLFRPHIRTHWSPGNTNCQLAKVDNVSHYKKKLGAERFLISQQLSLIVKTCALASSSSCSPQPLLSAVPRVIWLLSRPVGLALSLRMCSSTPGSQIPLDWTVSVLMWVHVTIILAEVASGAFPSFPKLQTFPERKTKMFLPDHWNKCLFI